MSHEDRPTSGKVRAVRGFVGTLPLETGVGFFGFLRDLRFDFIGRRPDGAPVYFDNASHGGLRDDRYHAIIAPGSFVSIEWEGNVPTFRVEWMPKVTACDGTAGGGAGFMIDPVTGQIVPIPPPPPPGAPPTPGIAPNPAGEA